MASTESQRAKQQATSKVWWPGTELNRRRQPFQGCALPPELPGHFGCALRLSASPGWTWVTLSRCRRWANAQTRQRLRWELAERKNYNNPGTFRSIEL